MIWDLFLHILFLIVLLFFDNYELERSFVLIVGFGDGR